MGNAMFYSLWSIDALFGLYLIWGMWHVDDQES